MARTTKRAQVSPIGSAVADRIDEKLQDPEYRAEHERLAPYEALARIVIMRRATHGVSQAELARRMQTTPSVVSRIETRQHATNARTLQRLAAALDARAVVGFEFGPENARERNLVVIWARPPAVKACCLAAEARYGEPLWLLCIDNGARVEPATTASGDA
ncbi:MAG: helix-turn-helix transcriptional regulator [Solirubrobacteraceae bacterium]